MKKFQITVVIIVCAMVSACGLADDLSEAMDARDAVEEELLNEYGLNSDVGFNITNGRLTAVSITVKSKEVAGMLVDDLITQIEPVVLRNFEQNPQALLVTVSVKP